MDTSKKRTLVPGIALIIGSNISALFWTVTLFYGYFLGGSPQPIHERMVPYSYVAIFGLGLVSAIIGLVMGIKSIRSVSGMVMIFVAIPLGIAGSIPFFLLTLTEVGVAALLFVVIPPLLYLGLNAILDRKNKKGE